MINLSTLPKYLRYLWFSIVFCILSINAAGSFPQNKTFQASGTNEWIITIDSCARYSVSAQSEQGTSLEILDKKKGVIATDGTIGQADGRIDIFLDKGEYKIRSASLSKGKGTLSISLNKFKELNQTPTQLVPEKECIEQCKDLEQRSWWIYVPSDTLVFIEAQGRQINELSLWHLGEWRVDCHTSRSTNKIIPEKPLRVFRIIDKLQKGFYLVTAYGGKNDGYTVQNDKYPLVIKFGLNQLAAAGTYQYNVSNTGVNRYLLSPSTSHVVLESATKKTMYIDVAQISSGSDINIMASDSIFSKSSSPRTVVSVNNQGTCILTVSGIKNEPFTITTIGSTSTNYYINYAGKYWISTIHTGNPDDNIGASGLIVDSRNSKIIAVQADTISSKLSIKRRCNLLGRISLFVWADDDASYLFDVGESKATYQVKRFFVGGPPSDYKEPEFVKGKNYIHLNKGLYTIAISPIEKGVCTFSVSSSGLAGAAASLVKSIVSSNSDENTPARRNLQFSEINIPADAYIYCNNQFPELSSFVVRTLPLNLQDALSFNCNAGQKLSISFKCDSASVVKMLSKQNVPLKFDLDNVPYAGKSVAAGTHTITFSNTSQNSIQATVETKYESIASASTIPFNNEVKKFPDALPGTTSYFDLPYDGKIAYQFLITEPGIYRVETVGRLSTSIYVRDRLMQFVAQSNEKSVGRNAILVDYLVPGLYQIVAGVEGRSAGHAGVLVNKNSLIKGGDLDCTFEKRNFAPAYSAIEYGLSIKDDGSYSVESYGRNNTFNARLEDSLGWPIVQHGSATPLSLDIPKGNYRLISLPVISDARRIAKITRQDNSTKIKGKGPHQLVINSPISAEWLEETAKDTIPMQFTIHIPARLEATLSVSPGFNASCYVMSKDSLYVKWKGSKKITIATGDYCIKIRPTKPGNHIPFEISATTTDLVAGTDYSVTKPRTFRVEIGEKGVYEFLSQGMMDVSAKLLSDNAKTELAENDDGYLDWNFSVSKELTPGRYFFKVISEEAQFSQTHLFMRYLRDTLYETLTFDGKDLISKNINLQSKQIVLPLSIPDKAEIIAVRIKGESQLACMLELEDASGRHTIADKRGSAILLTAPVIKGQKYILKVWSVDHINENISLSCRAVTPEIVTLNQIKNGIKGSANESNDQTAWFKVLMSGNGPSQFYVESDNNPLEHISSTDKLNKSFFEEQTPIVSVNDTVLYLETVFNQADRYNVQLRPVVVSPKNTFSVHMYKSTSRTLDIECPKNTGSLVFISANPGFPLGGILSESNTRQWFHDGFSIGTGSCFDDNLCVVPVISGDYAKVSFWNSSSNDLSYVTVSSVNYDIASEKELPSGTLSWNKSDDHIAKFTISDKQHHSLKITLPSECGVLYQSADKNRTFNYAPSDIQLVTIEIINGGVIYLFRKDAEKTVKIDNFINNNLANEDLLQQGVTIQKSNSFPGKFIIPFSNVNKSNTKIFWSGNIQNVDFIDEQGFMHSSIPDGGTIYQNRGQFIVSADNGWCKLSACDAGLSREQSFLCRWETSLPPQVANEIKSSSIVNLKDGVNWFKFRLNQDTHLQFSIPSPLTSILFKNNTPIHFQESWDGFNWDLPLSEGDYTIGFKNLAGRSLNGIPLTVSFKDINVLSEKKLFHDFIGPGESKILSFKANTKTRYGIGIAMSNETADARIYDRSFRQITSGKQQFISLDTGTYFIWLRVPSVAEGTEITMYLFGQEPPPNEPPEYLVQWIINGEEGSRPTSDNRSRSQAPQVQWSEDDNYNSQQNFNDENNSNSEYQEESSEQSENYSEESSSSEEENSEEGSNDENSSGENE